MSNKNLLEQLTNAQDFDTIKNIILNTNLTTNLNTKLFNIKGNNKHEQDFINKKEEILSSINETNLETLTKLIYLKFTELCKSSNKYNNHYIENNFIIKFKCRSISSSGNNYYLCELCKTIYYQLLDMIKDALLEIKTIKADQSFRQTLGHYNIQKKIWKHSVNSKLVRPDKFTNTLSPIGILLDSSITKKERSRKFMKGLIKKLNPIVEKITGFKNPGHFLYVSNLKLGGKKPVKKTTTKKSTTKKPLKTITKKPTTKKPVKKTTKKPTTKKPVKKSKKGGSVVRPNDAAVVNLSPWKQAAGNSPIDLPKLLDISKDVQGMPGIGNMSNLNTVPKIGGKKSKSNKPTTKKPTTKKSVDKEFKEEYYKLSPKTGKKIKSNSTKDWVFKKYYDKSRGKIKTCYIPNRASEIEEAYTNNYQISPCAASKSTTKKTTNKKPTTKKTTNKKKSIGNRIMGLFK